MKTTVVKKVKQTAIQKNIAKYPSQFTVLAIDPSFAGCGWVLSEIDLKNMTFSVTYSGTNCSIKDSKLNKYKLLSEYINELITSLGNVNYVITEGQFFKSMYMIVGAVIAGIPDGIPFLNLTKKNDNQPIKIRKIVAGKQILRTKEDVRNFLNEHINIPADWTHDTADAFMVLVAYLKSNFGLTLENYSGRKT